MKDYQDVATWFGSLKGPEAPYPALTEWLEFEKRRSARRQWLRVAAFFGCIAGLVVILIGCVIIVNGAFQVGRDLAYILLLPAGLAVAAAPLFLGAFLLRRSVERRRALAIDPEVARAVVALRTMRTHRRLRRKLGHEGALELNEGAVLYFRCRMALLSDAWNSQTPTEPWGEARTAMLAAMEAAMGRLALCVSKQRAFTEIGPILEEMRAATNEAVRVTELRAHTAGSAGQGLRASTQRMRELAKTEEDALAELRITL